jgi:hypothetical protein
VPHPDITCIPSTRRSNNEVVRVLLVDHLSGLAALAPLYSFIHLTYSVMDELVPSNGPRPDPRGKYDSIQGRQLCKKILAKYVTYDPHDYILDGVCPVIDGFNLLATTPTGSGKTGFFTLLMLVREIAADKTLAIGNEVFPIDPVMIVVCPTKALEEDIVGLVITNDGMLLTLAKATQSREAGLTAIVINSDTVDLARKWCSRCAMIKVKCIGYMLIILRSGIRCRGRIHIACGNGG